jgi:hypothetical protein
MVVSGSLVKVEKGKTLQLNSAAMNGRLLIFAFEDERTS